MLFSLPFFKHPRFRSREEIREQQSRRRDRNIRAASLVLVLLKSNQTLIVTSRYIYVYNIYIYDIYIHIYVLYKYTNARCSTSYKTITTKDPIRQLLQFYGTFVIQHRDTEHAQLHIDYVYVNIYIFRILYIYILHLD